MISTSRTSDFQISGSAISSHKNIQIRHMNDEDHVLLSEKLEDQLKAVEWANW